MDIIKKIDAMIEERSLLKHPFYQMWSDGKLTQESLAGYSKEYFSGSMNSDSEYNASSLSKA